MSPHVPASRRAGLPRLTLKQARRDTRMQRQAPCSAVQTFRSRHRVARRRTERTEAAHRVRAPHGRAGEDPAPSRQRPAAGARAHRCPGRCRQLRRGGRARRQRPLRRQRPARRLHSVEPGVRPRHDRAAPGGGGRRRFHRARRRQRRRGRRQDDRGREDGARPAHPDRAPGRRHRRWRLGEDDRAKGLHAAAQGARVARRDAQPRHRAGGRARLGLGRRPRRGPCRGEPLQRDGQGHVAAVRGRPAGGRTHRPEDRQERTRRQPDPHAQRRGRRRGRERGRGIPAHAALSVVPAAVGVRAAAAQRHRARARGRRRPTAHGDSRQPARGLQDPRHRRGAGRCRLVLRDRPPLGQGQRDAASRASMAGR